MFSKKAFIAVVVMVAVAAFAAVGPISPAEKTAAAGATIVSVDGTCGFIDANGVLWDAATSEGHIVVTTSSNGNVETYCRGTLPAGAALPHTAIHYNSDTYDAICTGAPGETWKMTVAPNGIASFTCHAP